MNSPVLGDFETLDPNLGWEYFCEAFNVSESDVDFENSFAQKMRERVDFFWMHEPKWGEDIADGNADEEAFKISFKKSLSTPKIVNAFNAFLSLYAEFQDAELAFDVEVEERQIKLSKYITRWSVMVRRLLLPLEIHDYETYRLPWLAWLLIAEKLVDQTEDLTAKEANQFSAGLTIFKQDFLDRAGQDQIFTLEGKSIDLNKAVILSPKCPDS